MINYLRMDWVMKKHKKKKKIKKWWESYKNKHPHYYKLFQKFILNGYKLNEIYDFSKDLERDKNLLYLLPKQAINYTDLNELSDDLSYCINEYTSLRNIPAIKKYLTFLKKEDFKKVVYNDRRLSVLFYDKCSVKKHLKILNSYSLPIPQDYIKYLNDRESEFIKNIESTSSEIIYKNNNIVIIKVIDHISVKKLGPPKWCIRKKVDFDDIVSDKSTQIIIKNFNKLIDMTFGVTLTKKLKIKYIFDEDNDERNKTSIKKYLEMVIVKPKPFLKNYQEQF